MTILAIDQGTNSTRGLAVDDDGNAVVIRTVDIQQYYPAPGRVEHDPLALLGSIKACIDACVDRHPGPLQIGIDNQGESCLAWNRRTGQPVTPVIVWQDNRTEATVESLKLDGAESLTMERAGLPLDSYFSASKLGWILEHCEAAKALLQSGDLGIGTTDAFFLQRLTGQYVTDITTASRTSLMNLKTRQWGEDLCALFGVPPEILPEIVPTTGKFGVVDSYASEPEIVASIVDQQASLYGHGCRQAGDTKITFGTGAFALMVTGNEFVGANAEGLLPTIAWQASGQQPTYALDGGVYCAGSAINWGRSIGLFNDYGEINQFSKPPALSRGLAFVPALSGLGCPHWDRRAAGLWIGLALDTDRQDMIQSVLEGVALRAVEVVSAMEQHGEPRDTISVDGGLTANPWFCQFLSDALGKQVIVQSSAELTALGTAQLAGAMVNTPGSINSAIYQPKQFPDEWRQQFELAVGRSKDWRRGDQAAP